MAAQDEFDQLERVFLHLGLAETDEQLQTVVAKFLPPVLLKLSSSQEGVRKKVMELLVHLNKRIKSRPQVLLPVETLLLLYQDPSATSFVTNFAIIYIKLGFPRLPIEERCELVPSLVASLAGKPPPQQDSLMQLLVPVLNHLKFPADSTRRAAMFGLAERQGCAQMLLDFLLDTLMMPYGSGYQSEGPEDSGSSRIPPGMSLHGVKRVCGDTPLSAEELEQCKMGVLRLLEQEIFPDSDIIAHLVLASSDGHHSVATAAERELRRKQGSIDWNSVPVVNSLYRLYLGDAAMKHKGSPQQDLKREPTSARVKLKIVPHLLRSRHATDIFPAFIQVIFDGLFGNASSPKLRLLTLQFLHHVCTSCSDNKMEHAGPLLHSALTKIISEHREDPRLRNHAYSAIGKLALRAPKLFSRDIGLTQQFMEALCKEDPDGRLAIQEALSLMAGAYSSLKGADLKLMEALVEGYIEKPEPQARQVAVKFASRVFSSDHIPSRYLLLLAAGDIKEEVCAEAQQVLRSQSHPEGNLPCKLPPFTDMVFYIKEKAEQRLKSSMRVTVGAASLPFNPAAYGEMVLFLRMCLAHSAGIPPTSQSFAEMRQAAPELGKYLHSLLRSSREAEAMNIYISLLQQLIQAIGGAPVLYCLLEVVAVCPKELTQQFVDKLPWIKGLMRSSRDEMRELAAQLFAVVITCPVHPDAPALLKNLLKDSQDQSLEVQHGSVLALGYTLSRLLGPRNESGMDTDKTVAPIDEETIQSIVTMICNMLGSSTMLLSMAGCIALGELARSAPLPLPDSGESVSKAEVVQQLLAKLHSGKEQNKVKEKVVQTLGLMPVGDPNFPNCQSLLKGLMDSVEPRQVELQFCIAEALCCASMGIKSSAARDMWMVDEKEYVVPSGVEDEVAWLLQIIFEKYIVSQNPHVRQAACIWLLTLVKQLGDHDVVQSRLQDIQKAFIMMLSETDELTQDLGSKGLGLVYEKGGEADRKALVDRLVETLTTGSRPKRDVTEETQVFPVGLGTTPEGHGLSTYRELCSLASDLNQPDLVYKFMHLANHHAVWNSKKGAAFGFATIARQAGEALSPHLPGLVPRLYRYQFDPNPGVRHSMVAIWTALVPEAKKTVEKYLQEILKDLLSNLTSDIWRVRESSCLALNDLLRGHSADLVDRLPDIWKVLFSVRDDIKDSVRKAADHTLKTLSKVTIRLCDEESAGRGQRAITGVLPCLLDQGITSSVEEIRTLSISTLVKVSKGARQLLRPHVSRVVPALLEALAGLEPQVLSYLSLRASQNEQVQMDSLRLSAAKSSPLMETITMCVQQADHNSLTELIPRLVDLLRRGVGLGTKGGSAHVVVLLITQCPQDLTPFAGKLMSALVSGLTDRNTTIQQAYATALAHLVKVAHDSSTEKLLKKLTDWYLDKEDATLHYACALTMHSISQHYPDALHRHGAIALPLAFLGMNEATVGEKEPGSNSALWSTVWDDNVPGNAGGVRLYLDELLALSQKALQSRSWNLKAQGAAAIAATVKLQGASLRPAQLGVILGFLLQGLPGRIWTGKEQLLKAISSAVTAASDSVKDLVQPSLPELLDALEAECRRENVQYRMAALTCFSEVLQATGQDRFSELAELLFPLISQSKLGQEVIREEKDEEEKKPLRGQLEICIIQCLGKSWPKSPSTQEEFAETFYHLLCQRLALCPWKEQVAILQALHTFVDRLCWLERDHVDTTKVSALLKELAPALSLSLGNKSYSSVRTEALVVLELLLSKLKGLGLSEAFAAQCESLRSSLAAMDSDRVPELRDRANNLLIHLNDLDSNYMS